MENNSTATDKALTFPIVGAICLLFLGNSEGIGLLMQLSALSLMVSSATLALILGKVKKTKLGLNEWLLLSIGVISSLSSAVNDQPYSMQYSALFLATIITAIILSRALSFKNILDAVALGFAVMVCASILLDPASYLVGVAAQSIKGIGLLRYTQFNLHPNLAGFIYGGGTIILWVHARQKSGVGRTLFFILSGLSFSLVLAASSRAGMLATVTAFSLTGLTRLFPLSRRNATRLLLIGVAIISSLVLTNIGQKLIDYVVKISDMESSTRGLGSGGSGRIELWTKGLNLIANRDIIVAALGTGLRSAEIGIIGFSTESSYINILIENGLLLGAAALIVLLVSAPARLLRSRNGSVDDLVVGMLLTFALIESIFNRYLLAIGNPLSLYYLFIYITIFRAQDISHKIHRKFTIQGHGTPRR